MTREKENVLSNRYPQIFPTANAPRGKDKYQLCRCDDGWSFLLDEICAKIQFLCDRFPPLQIEATQVKEKYGTLRFYYKLTSPDQLPPDFLLVSVFEDLVFTAMARSSEICEVCGSPAACLCVKTGHFKTLCQSCATQRSYSPASSEDAPSPFHF